MNYVQFIDEFYSNLPHKNKYNPHFQPLPDMSLWLIYINPNIYRCLIRWWANKDLRKSTCLRNNMDAREGHLLNRYDIYS